MIRSLRSQLLTGMVGLCLCQTAPGQEVEIVMPLFGNLVTERGDGLYEQLFYEAADRIRSPYTVRHYPFKRAVQYFVEHAGSCLIADDVTRDRIERIKLVSSYPFGAAKVHIFSLRGQPVVSSMDELEGKRLGGTRHDIGYYGPVISRGIAIDYAPTQILSLEKLKAGRVDAILGIVPDFIPYLGQVDFDPDHPLTVFYDRLICHDNGLGRSVTERVSEALEAMKSEGFTQGIMGSQHVEFDY